MILCELGQAWKGAAAADDSCAGMWLEARHPNSFILQFFCFSYSSLFHPSISVLYLWRAPRSFPFDYARFAANKKPYLPHIEYNEVGLDLTPNNTSRLSSQGFWLCPILT